MTRPDLQKKIEGLKTANRRVLYTDTINGGKQAMRDDLWAVSTEEVEAILSAVDQYVKEHDMYVIGEKHLTNGGYDEGYFKNELRAKQLKRAGIE